MTDVTGRLDALEAQVVNLSQQNLHKIDIDTLGLYQQIVNQSVSLANSSYQHLAEKVNTLQALYSNLLIDIAALSGNMGGPSSAEDLEAVRQYNLQYTYMAAL